MQKLVENVRVHGDTVQRLPLNESTVRINENELRSVSSAFKVPIWRIDEKNLNNRIYPRKVAEKVVQENKTTVCLADHPNDEGSVWNIVAVAKNPIIEEGLLWADAYFVDEQMAKKIEKIVEYGGEIGLSSSAYGEVDREGKVMEEGFEIDRYFDLVLEPSYQVYIDPSTTRLGNQNNSFQASESVSQPKRENLTMSHEANTKENPTMQVDKLQEANLRMNLKTMVEKAEEKDSLFAKRDALKEVLEYTEEGVADDIRQDVEGRVASVNEEIENLATKGVSYEQVQTKAEEAKNEAEKLKEELDQKASLYESKLSSLQKKYDKANEIVESLRESLSEAQEKATWEEARKNSRVDAQAYADLMESYNELKESYDELEDDYQEAQEKLKKAQKSEKTTERSRKRRSERLRHEDRKEEGRSRPVNIRKPVRSLKNRQEESEKPARTPKKVRSLKNKPVEESNEFQEEDGIDMDFSNKDEVTQFFQERVAEDSRYKYFENEITSCKTLQEAQIKAMNVDLDSVSGGVSKGSTKTSTGSSAVLSEGNKVKSPVVDPEDEVIGRVKHDGWV